MDKRDNLVDEITKHPKEMKKDIKDEKQDLYEIYYLIVEKKVDDFIQAPIVRQNVSQINNVSGKIFVVIVQKRDY